MGKYSSSRLLLVAVIASLTCFVMVVYVPSLFKTFEQVETKAVATTVIEDVTIVDVKSGELIPNQSIVIENNRIARIDSKEFVPIPEGAKVYPAVGQYVIPGLWDMHVHLNDQYETAFPLLLANGVTGLRDMGAGADDIQGRHNLLAKGVLAPRIMHPGSILDTNPPWYREPNVRTEQEAREAVQAMKGHGASFIKPYAHIPESILLHIMDEANKQGIHVSGHLPMGVRAEDASNLGLKSIEHLIGMFLATSDQEEKVRADARKTTYYYEFMESDIEAAKHYDEAKADRLFALLKKNETWQVPTLALTYYTGQAGLDSSIIYVPEKVQKEWIKHTDQLDHPSRISKIFMDYHPISLELIGNMHRAGVPIMAGTDSQFDLPKPLYGFAIHKELQLFVEAGLTPHEALQTATLHPAQYMNREDELGSIEVGKLADMVLLRNNPLERIEHTQQISAVVLDGNVMEYSQLKQMMKTYKPVEIGYGKATSVFSVAVANEVGAMVTWDPLKQTVKLQKGEHLLTFQINSPIYIWNQKQYYAESAFRIKYGRSLMPIGVASVIQKW
ncbi:amidohydrolase family protein [Paenibacillus arenosi]|uniref:Amidohydrolase family protein n=1 Tax=Paenibacillus arenosi TaxID=2774142 RepID=A0ABR9AVW6_9BACL|nr:amidohydrolase family protein [Paenibacillus arenosi]MBD8497377.1 amidohydrolase family protein [Paenibacillus arenosi]